MIVRRRRVRLFCLCLCPLAGTHSDMASELCVLWKRASQGLFAAETLFTLRTLQFVCVVLLHTCGRHDTQCLPHKLLLCVVLLKKGRQAIPLPPPTTHFFTSHSFQATSMTLSMPCTAGCSRAYCALVGKCTTNTRAGQLLVLVLVVLLRCCWEGTA